jgi:lipopolysaccharide transport system ATP-binding protein
MKDSGAVVVADGVSKKFCKSLKYAVRYGVADIVRATFSLGGNSSGMLRDQEFWAVHGVSFKLEKGEALGVIGPNGSGKSTLLKLLNGIFMPDEGVVKIKGRVGALIEVGAGFHPMLTGRENIYVNGAILGMSRREIERKFTRIADFAEIGEFLDAPVKTYSSGMFVRLGFSIAVHSDPDILLVDEVLAVGDYNFQRKCFEKIRSGVKRGMSLVLVTHSMNSLVSVADRAILLGKGKVKFSGSTKGVIDRYIEESNKNAAYGHLRTATRRGSGEMRIIRAGVVDDRGNEVTEIPGGSPIRIRCSFRVNKVVKDPVFFFSVRDAISREPVLFCSSEGLFRRKTLKKDGEFEFVFNKPRLGPRRFYLRGGVVTKDQYSVPVDMWDDAGKQFVVTRVRGVAKGKIDLLATPIAYFPYGFSIKFKG